MHSTRKRRPSANPAAISGQLREIIAGRSLTAYSVAQSAGVSPSLVSRFLSRERGLTLGTFDAIAAGLGLRLVETGRGRGRPSKPGPVREAAKKVDGSPGDRARLDPDPERHAAQDRRRASHLPGFVPTARPDPPRWSWSGSCPILRSLRVRQEWACS